MYLLKLKKGIKYWLIEWMNEWFIENERRFLINFIVIIVYGYYIIIICVEEKGVSSYFD